MNVHGAHRHHASVAIQRDSVTANAGDDGAKHKRRGHDRHAHGHHKRAHAAGGGSGRGTGGCGDAITAASALGDAQRTELAATVPASASAPATGAAATEQGGVAAQLLSYVARSLAGAPIADQVLAMLQQNGAAINVISDEAFSAKYGRASGIYDPNTKQVTLPESVTQNPEELRIVLLHEGVHWVQNNVPGGIAQAGGAVAQALQGAGALHDLDRSSKASSQHDEAQAFLLEALVAKELGINDQGMGTSGGRVLGYDATLARVKETPEYQ